MIALATVGPGHLIVLGAAFGVVHGIVFPALMALILGPPRRNNGRGCSRSPTARSTSTLRASVCAGMAGRAGYPAVFVVTGAVTTGTAAMVLARRRRAPVSVSST